MFTKAIVTPPAANFSEGLTTSQLGLPNYELAIKQHEAYCEALQECGLSLTRLEADPNHPDSTFVEDTAVLTERLFVIATPGAPSRSGEVAKIRSALASVSTTTAVATITESGTLDGGDVCEAGKHFFIGISQRTNEAGARQLAELLAPFGYTSSLIDIRDTSGLLHLKSGVAYLGDNRLVINEALAHRQEFAGYQLLRLEAREEYAANCIRVNDAVLIAARFPAFEANLKELGYRTMALELSEFQKMDGGLSCLSLRL
jgi:dimethylargininase